MDTQLLTADCPYWKEQGLTGLPWDWKKEIMFWFVDTNPSWLDDLVPPILDDNQRITWLEDAWSNGHDLVKQSLQAVQFNYIADEALDILFELHYASEDRDVMDQLKSERYCA